MQNWISEPGGGLGAELRDQRVPEERRDGILAQLEKGHWKQDTERQGNVTANKAILSQERLKYDEHYRKMKEQTDAEEEVCKAVIAKITVKLETKTLERAEKARLRLNNFIASFGELLIEHAGVRQWVEYSFVHNSIDAIEEEINESLITYASEMAHETRCPSPESGNFTRFSEQSTKELIESTQVIRRYRRNIALYLCYKIVSATPGDWFSYSKRLRVLSDYERFGLIEVEHASVKMYTMELEPIRDRLIHGESFQRMVSRIQHTLYRDDGHAMETVKSCVQAHQTYGQPFASFTVELPIREFMSSQYEKNNHRVGSVVVVTGSSLYAQATTCEKYLCQTWPRSEAILLELLDSALASEGSFATFQLGEQRVLIIC
ncbi:hypothetical protein IQ07DRAFT_125481 [Pyrenochaeta sp. DS3sAY3a]|nr:hypothetical protein IQ07DRAFT_125481 [Pyrenochaeta sp. DS3sAY3a]